jgi:hypothetical protein
MSTELQSTKGLEEFYPKNFNFLTDSPQYKETEMHINSFSGGKRGRCIQLTPQNRYVQLDRAGVQELVNTLSEWLEETKS